MEQSVVGRNAPEASRGVDLPDRYEPSRLIGVGGMATIWAAEDGLLRRSVAVKVLADQFAEQPRFVERFQREARTAASLSGHPHVVTIYDVGTHAGRPSQEQPVKTPAPIAPGGSSVSSSHDNSSGARATSGVPAASTTLPPTAAGHTTRSRAADATGRVAGLPATSPD